MRSIWMEKVKGRRQETWGKTLDDLSDQNERNRGSERGRESEKRKKEKGKERERERERGVKERRGQKRRKKGKIELLLEGE